MHATGYLETRSRHPVALVAALSINLAAVGVMLAYNPEIIGKRPDAIKLMKFPTPPMIVKPVERAKTDQPKTLDPLPRPRPVEFDPLVKTDPIDGQQTLWPELLPQSGAGTDPVVKPQPEPVVETSAGVDPRFARDLQPPYPPALERMDIEGKVTVRVQIGTDGRVAAVELVRADDPAFFTTTRDQALRRWRFRPAMRDGQPITSWVTKTVVFTIHRN
ncbi:MAG: TonB family protein [Sphingomonadales bacterium]